MIDTAKQKVILESEAVSGQASKGERRGSIVDVYRATYKDTMTIMRGGGEDEINLRKRNDFKQFIREMRPSLHDPSNIIRCQGYVFKLSRGKAWHKRFFQLAGHYLRYYQDHRCKSVKGAVDLIGLQKIAVDARYNGVFFKLDFVHRGLKREVQLKMLTIQEIE